MVLEQYAASSLIWSGIWDFILPFMLIFAVVYAILQKVKVFGKSHDAKKVNIVVGLVMGLLVVVPHALQLFPPYQDPVTIMQKALPQVSIIVVAILMALLIIGILGKRVELAGGSLSGWIALIAFGIIAYIFFQAARNPTTQGSSGLLWWLFSNPELMGLVVMILVFAIVIWFMTHEKDPNRADKDTIPKQLGNLLKGGDD